ncbi:MAG TPA: cupin domain-containing protein [Stellaceae bacterium]|nr:cupin domain-containing protein [Stellaceae bacterium]
MAEQTRKLLWRAGEREARQRAFAQRLNPNSYLLRTGLSRLAGLKRAHVSLGRVPPGKDSFAYHAHLLEEEWVYILSGRGIAEIDGESHEVGPGDFMGFPTPGVAHLLRNPFDADLVYLMGGEALPLDVLDYPKLGKRYLLVSDGGVPDFYELVNPTKPFDLAEPSATR